MLKSCREATDPGTDSQPLTPAVCLSGSSLQQRRTLKPPFIGILEVKDSGPVAQFIGCLPNRREVLALRLSLAGTRHVATGSPSTRVEAGESQSKVTLSLSYIVSWRRAWDDSINSSVELLTFVHCDNSVPSFISPMTGTTCQTPL